MRILHLTLKKKWFDMIASGEKKEEYREIKKYWLSRLTDETTGLVKEYDIIRFRNGYAKDSPTMDVEFKGATSGYGKREWGGGEHTFIIKLGKVLPNIEQEAQECDANTPNRITKAK